MSKIVTIPLLATVSVEVDDETLSEEDLIDLAIRAGGNTLLTIDDRDVTKDCGEGVFASVEEVACYSKLTEGNYYYGHIDKALVEDY